VLVYGLNREKGIFLYKVLWGDKDIITPIATDTNTKRKSPLARTSSQRFHHRTLVSIVAKQKATPFPVSLLC
jgi:hypothetical protein